ncbi:hypothetical protein HDU89_005645 [Geranomyces variabilis]|nr:hypothetical protein HDU89_005645 [Geranomyces variabilis]
MRETLRLKRDKLSFESVTEPLVLPAFAAQPESVSKELIVTIVALLTAEFASADQNEDEEDGKQVVISLIKAIVPTYGPPAECKPKDDTFSLMALTQTVVENRNVIAGLPEELVGDVKAHVLLGRGKLLEFHVLQAHIRDSGLFWTLEKGPSFDLRARRSAASQLLAAIKLAQYMSTVVVGDGKKRLEKLLDHFALDANTLFLLPPLPPILPVARQHGTTTPVALRINC